MHGVVIVWPQSVYGEMCCEVRPRHLGDDVGARGAVALQPKRLPGEREHPALLVRMKEERVVGGGGEECVSDPKRTEPV